MVVHSRHKQSCYFYCIAPPGYGSLFSDHATLTEANDTHFILPKPLLHCEQLAVPLLPDLACSSLHWLGARRPINVWR
jgi:hypothetical protein